MAIYVASTMIHQWPRSQALVRERGSKCWLVPRLRPLPFKSPAWHSLSGSWAWERDSRTNLTFSSCQRFSMGLAPGLSGGVFHQLMLFSAKNSLAAADVCFGSLSCMKRWPSGYTRRKNGSKPTFKISRYKLASIIPLKITSSVSPFVLMPPHT